jgi:hypothetical protein
MPSSALFLVPVSVLSSLVIVHIRTIRMYGATGQALFGLSPWSIAQSTLYQGLILVLTFLVETPFQRGMHNKYCQIQEITECS